MPTILESIDHVPDDELLNTDGLLRIRSWDLRFALTAALLHPPPERPFGICTVQELIGDLARWGLVPADRPSKLVSDVLRSEIRKGRVERLIRGHYRVARGPNGGSAIPRTTRQRIEQRATDLRHAHDRLFERRLRAIALPTLLRQSADGWPASS